MLNVYGNLLATVVLLRGVLAVVARKGDAERLERDLLTGLADVDSAAPGLALWHIAETARAELAAKEALLACDPRTMRVEGLPDGPTRRAVERFLTAYGYRGAREAEIAEPRWSEDPTLPFATLRAHLERAERGRSPLDIERRQRQVRDAAQKELEPAAPRPLEDSGAPPPRARPALHAAPGAPPLARRARPRPLPRGRPRRVAAPRRQGAERGRRRRVLPLRRRAARLLAGRHRHARAADPAPAPAARSGSRAPRSARHLRGLPAADPGAAAERGRAGRPPRDERSRARQGARPDGPQRGGRPPPRGRSSSRPTPTWAGRRSSWSPPPS